MSTKTHGFSTNCQSWHAERRPSIDSISVSELMHPWHHERDPGPKKETELTPGCPPRALRLDKIVAKCNKVAPKYISIAKISQNGLFAIHPRQCSPNCVPYKYL